MAVANIRVRAAGVCQACGRPGDAFYSGIRDSLFEVAGEWAMKRCGSCGLLWLDPVPLEEDIGKAYDTYYTHTDTADSSAGLARRLYGAVRDGYVAGRFGYPAGPLKKMLGKLAYAHPGRRADFDHCAMYLKARPGGRLLEVGCGGGDLLKGLEALGWRVEGLDFDPRAVSNARGKGLDVRHGTIEAQRYGDGTFDAVFMGHVLEHVHDPLKLLRECARILKKGGTLVAVTPNCESLGHRLFKAAWRGLEVPRHICVYSPRALGLLAGKARFADVSVKVTIRNARGIFLASRAIRKAAKAGPGNMAVVGRPGLGPEAWQFVEWFLCKFYPKLGEELVLTAKK